MKVLNDLDEVANDIETLLNKNRIWHDRTKDIGVISKDDVISSALAVEVLHNFTLIHDDIMEACEKLDKEKENHGGKKNYHTMIAFYFYDMAKTWKEIRRIMKKNSQICFVVGDSAPYGIHVPVEKWLGKLAISSGFNSPQLVAANEHIIIDQ